jgi:ferrous iron transport protein B
MVPAFFHQNISGQHHVFQNDTNTEVKGVVPKRLQTQETLRRYDNIDQIIDKVRSKRTMLKDLLTEKLDRLMVHKFWGYVLFLVVLLIIFRVYSFWQNIQGWIEDLFTWFSTLAATYLPEGPLNSLDCRRSARYWGDCCFCTADWNINVLPVHYGR